MRNNMNESEQRNKIIMPEVGIIIEEFYSLMERSTGDPFIIQERDYRLFKDNLFKLRLLGGHHLAQSIGDPQSTYVILKRFDELIESFEEEKKLFGSKFSLPRNLIIIELNSIKEFAKFASSKLLRSFK
jgi:hypothetical protein